MMGFGMLLMVLFWGLLVVGTTGLVKSVFRNDSRQTLPGFEQETQTAREILDQRFARGEIKQEEYRRMKEDLD